MNLPIIILLSTASLVFVLILVFLILSLDRVRSQTIADLRSQIKDLNETIQNLLNRIQAGDLKAFHSLNTDFTETATIQPKTDSAELEQLKALGHLSGLGEEIYDDEFNATASEFGFDIPDGSVPGDDE